MLLFLLKFYYSLFSYVTFQNTLENYLNLYQLVLVKVYIYIYIDLFYLFFLFYSITKLIMYYHCLTSKLFSIF